MRVRATTVCAGDVRLRRAAPFFLRAYSGLFRPSKINILGMEFAGAVESIGKGVTLFDPGDEVFGSTGLRFGAYAEYVCVSEGPLLARRPDRPSALRVTGVPRIRSTRARPVTVSLRDGLFRRNIHVAPA